MIKFFRIIRQKLLTENKFSKYLLYAIGEIILVVIGILIAVSINNWNKNQINKKLEVKVLNELKKDFETTYEAINSKISRIEELEKNSKNIISLLENEVSLENHSEKLNKMGGVIGFLGGYGGVFKSFNTSYKYLESTGISLISNDSIRISITKMHEASFKNIYVREQQYLDFFTNEYEPFVTENFEFEINKLGKVNISQVKLNSSKDFVIFKNILIKKASHEKFRIYWLNETLDKLEDLIDDLEIEINYLKKN